MQRAAAKSSPSTPDGPPAKKARLSNGSAVGTSDREIIQSGLDAEEAKRQAALDKAAQHAGETKWVLSFKDPLEGKRQDAMNVRQAGFAELDAEDDEEDEEEEIRPIRMQFGGGVKKKADVRIKRPVGTIELTCFRIPYPWLRLKTQIRNLRNPRTTMIQKILRQILSDRRSARWRQRGANQRKCAQVQATNQP